MDSKPWYASKTLWVNIATFVSLALMLPEFGAVIPDSAAKYIAALTAVLNLGLRLFASQDAPLTLTAGAADKKNLGLLLALALIPALALSACGGKPVMLVAQTGQTLAGAIGQAQRATSSLMEAHVITPSQARAVHVTLLRANDRLKPLPDILLAIDAATQAGQSDAARIDAALAILQAVGVDLDAVVAGLPVGQSAAQILKAATEARKLVAQISAALARARASLSPPAPVALAGGAR